MLTADELAHRHGVTAQTIWRWYRQGRIVGICYNMSHPEFWRG